MENGLRYVSEKEQPLGNFTPPSDVPAKWFIRPPPPNETFYKNSQLWGWRTNLERAIKKIDEERVINITNAHSVEEVREFCEIRNLLNKFAERGMKDSCRLLLDHCHVAVEGVQDPHLKDEWLTYMKPGQVSSNGRTPLMIAAQDGWYEICELLLDHNASIIATDEITGRNALAISVYQGHTDIVKLLCKEDASAIGIKDLRSSDCIDAAEEQCCKNDNCSAKLYGKILEILREHDDRCSCCKAKPPVLLSCPCGKERYCDPNCQKKRWKEHKGLHAKVMEKSTKKC